MTDSTVDTTKLGHILTRVHRALNTRDLLSNNPIPLMYAGVGSELLKLDEDGVSLDDVKELGLRIAYGAPPTNPAASREVFALYERESGMEGLSFLAVTVGAAQMADYLAEIVAADGARDVATSKREILVLNAANALLALMTYDADADAALFEDADLDHEHAEAEAQEDADATTPDPEEMVAAPTPVAPDPEPEPKKPLRTPRTNRSSGRKSGGRGQRRSR